MQRTQRVRAVFGAAAAAVIVTGIARGLAPIDGQYASSRPSGDAPLAMTKLSDRSNVRIGDFPGKLVCLRDDLDLRAKAVARCEEDGHHHALSMDRGSMILPLLIGSEQARTQIHAAELNGKEVTLHGKYYPDTRSILVDRIAHKD
jgi:hypothetical protein